MDIANTWHNLNLMLTEWMYILDIYTVPLKIKSKAHHNKQHHLKSENQKFFYIVSFLIDHFYY